MSQNNPGNPPHPLPKAGCKMWAVINSGCQKGSEPEAIKLLIPENSEQWLFSSVIEVLFHGHSAHLPAGGKSGLKTPLRGCQDSGSSGHALAVCQMSCSHPSAQSTWRGKRSIREEPPPDFSLLPHDGAKLGNCSTFKAGLHRVVLSGNKQHHFLNNEPLSSYGVWGWSCGSNLILTELWVYQPTCCYPFHCWLDPALWACHSSKGLKGFY